MKYINGKIKKGILALTVFSIILCFGLETGAATVSASVSLSSRAEKIVKKEAKSSNKKKKLKNLFRYVEKNYGYARQMGFKTYTGWEKDYATEMYSKKKGSCYHFAAAYSFLAKKATGYEVRIGVGKTNGFSGNLQAHAWTEIKINSKWYICDTNMDKFAEKSSGKYFLKKRDSLKKTYDNFKNAQYFTTKF